MTYDSDDDQTRQLETAMRFAKRFKGESHIVDMIRDLAFARFKMARSKVVGPRCGKTLL